MLSGPYAEKLVPDIVLGLLMIVTFHVLANSIVCNFANGSKENMQT